MNTQPIEAIIAALAQLIKPHLSTDTTQLEEILPNLVRAYLDEHLPSMVEQCAHDIVDQAVETYLDDNLEDRVSDAVSNLTFSVTVE